MVRIPGGEFSMGSEGKCDGKSCCSPTTVAEALPIHRVYVDGFWMDATDVTNAQFERFVKTTGYVSIADHEDRFCHDANYNPNIIRPPTGRELWRRWQFVYTGNARVPCWIVRVPKEIIWCHMGICSVTHFNEFEEFMNDLDV